MGIKGKQNATNTRTDYGSSFVVLIDRLIDHPLTLLFRDEVSLRILIVFHNEHLPKIL